MKRGRDEEDSQKTSFVKIESAVNTIVAHVSRWKDLCGCQYQLFKKVDKNANSATLHLGAFDEILCSAIMNVTKLPLPGDYVIADFGADVEKNSLWFRIARGTVQPLSKRVTFESTDDDDVDFKMRIARPEDVTIVREAIENVTRSKGHASWCVKELPATYAVRIRYTKQVPGEAFQAASVFEGSKMDFTTKTLVCVVKKKVPDIVN